MTRITTLENIINITANSWRSIAQAESLRSLRARFYAKKCYLCATTIRCTSCLQTNKRDLSHVCCFEYAMFQKNMMKGDIRLAKYFASKMVNKIQKLFKTHKVDPHQEMSIKDYTIPKELQ